METKKRIRPSLATYRELERRLNVANGHIELGTKQLSDLQRKHDIQEAANKELKESYDTAKVNLDIACDGIKFYKEAIDTNNKDLCKALADKAEIGKAFRAADEYAVKMKSGWDNTALWAFLLSIVTITCSAIQIFQWL